MSDKLLTIEDIAKQFGTSRRNVAERWVHKPDFPAPKVAPPIRGYRRWCASEVEAYAEAQARKPKSEAVRTALYRHFDAEGALLYVGISLSPLYRLASHRQAAWVERIASITLEWMPTRAAAEAAELEAIRGERPQFNKAGAEK